VNLRPCLPSLQTHAKSLLEETLLPNSSYRSTLKDTEIAYLYIWLQSLERFHFWKPQRSLTEPFQEMQGKESDSTVASEYELLALIHCIFPII